MMEIGHCKEEEGEETFFSAEEEEVEEEDKVKEKMEEEEVEEGFHGFEYRRSLFGLASRKKKLKREVERAEQDLDLENSEERDLTETEQLVKEMMDPYGLSLGIRLAESNKVVQESENLTNNNEENEESRDRAKEGGGERKLTVHEKLMGANSIDEGRGSDEESLHLHLSSSDEDDNATPVGLETDN